MEFLVVAVLAAVAIAAVVMTYRRMSGGGALARAFAAASPSSVEGARPNSVVVLTGTVRAIGTTPISEATSRPYVARDLRLRAFDGSSSAPTRPASQVIDFVIDDGSGLALVRGDGAVVALERDIEAPKTTLDRAPWADALLRAGGYSNGSPETCRLTVYEGVLAPGDRAQVAGVVAAPDDAARSLGASWVIQSGTHPVAVRRAPDAPLAQRGQGPATD